ncbi:Aste57867_13402 [Aphanomyces stellatus]|uniref:Aste57867_13402 protein n=1 Tax=Aphanomyces stellatus TaxID=120398 RepID=A0A485KY02_9STRA|nr:hypothetical protein As57867_013352 [Aphanomyces stellatus]VFT90241.1 Aste57867_13402 [Aphanomyces stellatus]
MSSTNSTIHENAVGHGAATFRAVCASCHSLRVAPEEGMAKGPSLDNIVGKKAASGSAFNFSNALKGANITWDDKTLFEFLQAPKQYVKGTKMNHPGIKDPTKRNDLIAYLKDQKLISH